jgi:hypothetical protein
MCRAVNPIEECVGSISQSPGSGSAGGWATRSAISPSEVTEFSRTVALSRSGVNPSADTPSRYSPAGTVATNDPNGSTPPPTTLRPMVSLTVNSACDTGWLTGSSTRQLSIPAPVGIGRAARRPAPVPCTRFLRLPSHRPTIYDTPRVI